MTDKPKLRPGEREPTTFYALGDLDNIDPNYTGDGRYSVPSHRMDEVLPKTDIWPEELLEPPLGYIPHATDPMDGEHGVRKAWAILVSRERERRSHYSLDELQTEYEFVLQLLGRQYRHDLAQRKEAIEAELAAREDPSYQPAVPSVREDLAAMDDAAFASHTRLWQGRLSDGGRGAALAMEEVKAIEAERKRRGDV